VSNSVQFKYDASFKVLWNFRSAALSPACFVAGRRPIVYLSTCLPIVSPMTRDWMVQPNWTSPVCGHCTIWTKSVPAGGQSRTTATSRSYSHYSTLAIMHRSPSPTISRWWSPPWPDEPNLQADHFHTRISMDSNAWLTVGLAYINKYARVTITSKVSQFTGLRSRSYTNYAFKIPNFLTKNSHLFPKKRLRPFQKIQIFPYPINLNKTKPTSAPLCGENAGYVYVLAYRISV